MKVKIGPKKDEIKFLDPKNHVFWYITLTSACEHADIKMETPDAGFFINNPLILY